MILLRTAPEWCQRALSGRAPTGEIPWATSDYNDKIVPAYLLGRFLAGMELGVHPEDIEDLNEPLGSLPLEDPVYGSGQENQEGYLIRNAHLNTSPAQAP
jgi:hypothetical protein